MKVTNLTRRRFLTSSALASAVVLMAGATITGPAALAVANSSDSTKALGALAGHLFPHAGVPAKVYGEIAAMLPPPGTDSSDFFSAMVAPDGTPWLALSEADQIEALHAQEGTPFFKAIHPKIQFWVYNNPHVWKAIGYGGPSVQHGGYIDDGFDDIDWLPGDDT